MEKPEVPQNLNEPQLKTKKFFKSKKNQAFALICIFVLALFAALFVRTHDNKPILALGQIQPEKIVPTPTPVPFAELTIPYLRTKKYQSSLGELERVGSNASYTSYVTNYTSDGLKINGLLTVPTGEEPLEGFPAIVFIHGYIPPASYQTTVNYASYVDSLASRGFVVFKIDLRGHGESEGEPGGGYYGSDYIIDALSARAALQTASFVNPDKIGLWGHSMAGNIVLRSLTVKPEIPAAVVWAGAVFTYEDWQKYGIDDGSYQPPPNQAERLRKRQELFDIYGQFSPDSPFWQQVAPTNYLGDLKGAIQLNHAIDDPVVNIGYSRDLAGLLTSNGVTHELEEYQSGGHNLTGAAFNAAMQNTAEFFERYLR